MLEHVDPEILLLSAEEAEDGAAAARAVLDLLPDVPAGKLAIAELAARDARRRRGARARRRRRRARRAATSALSSASRRPRSSAGAVRLRPGSTAAPPSRHSLGARPAAALRLVGIRYGPALPLLNPDEESIVPRAWEMAHGGGLDPGWYDYPSLFILLLAPFAGGLDEPSYGPARVVAVVLGLAGVARGLVARPGRVRHDSRRSPPPPSTAVATTHVAYSRMAVTDVLLTLGVTWRSRCSHRPARVGGRRGGPRRVGQVPRGVLLRCRSSSPAGARGGGSRVSAGLAAGRVRRSRARSSSCTPAQAWDDFRRVQPLARAGWLGFEDDPVDAARLRRAGCGTRSARSLSSRWRGSASPSVPALGGPTSSSRSFAAVYCASTCCPRARTSTATCCRSCPCSRVLAGR